MKNKIYFLVVLAFTAMSMNAQQIALSSQYMFNEFAFNPAVAGTKNFAPLTFSFRRQWMGMNEAPVTQNLSFHSFVGKNAGAGVQLYNDVAGPTRRTGLSGAFSYQIQTSEKTRLSFGLSANVTQFMMDRDQMITETPDDYAVQNNTFNQLIPDFNFGMYWYGERHFVGVSGYNLVQSTDDLFDLTKPVTNTLDRTIFAHAGYLFPLGESFAIEPSGMFRYMMNAPMSFDANLRFVIKDAYWLGGSYRYQDAIAIMIGADLGFLELGYSYDLGMSNLATYNAGSHEVFLTAKLSKGVNNRSPWHKRNRIYSSFSKD
ncbi:MAG: type IX secretion system membrane protein PorP/SprF [Flavobacteriales bacterium]|nr:type IX secretion system membrane protein PorP/SprF [Flavobacteriales bacterium]